MIETSELIHLVNSTKDYSVSNGHIYSLVENDWRKKKIASRENLVRMCYNLNLVDDDELSREELDMVSEEAIKKIGDIYETYTR